MKKEFKEYDLLYERLSAYGCSDYYPFHMPGHKRQELVFSNPYKIDITEIEGFDNLHHAREILLQAQNRLRDLYQSRRSYYLVNGSTCGLLSAIGALTKQGEEVIMARNCHKAIYNGVKIFNLKAKYVYPEQIRGQIQGSVTPESIENELKKNKMTKLVIITSPTYDGITSNIRKIADIVHKYNSYLIVDEAHGAHFPFSEEFPESAVSLGADIVIQSLHKTLPSFTQTAALHVAGEGICLEKIEEMLGIFQTSSPSYVLMAGIDQCVRILKQNGREIFNIYTNRLKQLMEDCKGLQKLHLYTKADYEGDSAFDVDPSKLLISTRGTNLTGRKLYECLLEKYHLQMEMYSAEYVLAMTSVMDTQEGFDRLTAALFEIDQDLEKREEGYEEGLIKYAYAPRKKVLELGELDRFETKATLLEECCGEICAEYIYLYPPGIPMIVPGEEISEEFISAIKKCMELGLKIQGCKDSTNRFLQTVVQF